MRGLIDGRGWIVVLLEGKNAQVTIAVLIMYSSLHTNYASSDILRAVEHLRFEIRSTAFRSLHRPPPRLGGGPAGGAAGGKQVQGRLLRFPSYFTQN